jgi:hypothetical protein
MRGSYPSWSEALRTLSPGGWVTQNMPQDAPRTAWERAQWDRCDTDALCKLADATAGVDVTSYVADVGVPTLILAPTTTDTTRASDPRRLASAAAPAPA